MTFLTSFRVKAMLFVVSVYFVLVGGALVIGHFFHAEKHDLPWLLTAAHVIAFVMACGYLYRSLSLYGEQLAMLRRSARHIRRALDENDYERAKVRVSGQDEFADLSLAFNNLVDSLLEGHRHREAVEQALIHLNQSLELKVEERTNQLVQQNQMLDAANRHLKETQAQLLQAEKMASIGQLAAGVAHEINNPLGFVSSNLATLVDYVNSYLAMLAALNDKLEAAHASSTTLQVQDIEALLHEQNISVINEDIMPLLDESIEGLTRVGEIVMGLKLFSRIDTDERQYFDVNDCIKTTLTMVNNKLKYTCEVHQDLGLVPAVMINVGKISQILTNLFVNAAQAMESSGQFGKLSIRTYADDSFVYVDVSDTGGGIQPEHMAKLFTPFFTTKPEGEGTGLGLSISFNIAQDHGGHLSVKSDYGTGSCFTLSLPIPALEELPDDH